MMGRMRDVLVNGELFQANCGDLLLDAALLNGIDIPHDCRAGYCGTCRVRVLDGIVLGGPTSDPDSVLACQCRVISNLRVVLEDVPETATVAGRVVDLVPLARDIEEVCIELWRPPQYLPGQHYKVEFRGFPPRSYSPTVPLDGSAQDRVVRFHVRKLSNGRVSSALGRTIRQRHRAKLTGPFGSAYLRPHVPERIVLVASGTGFAPLWSIANAALKERPERELVFVVGARTLESLYMIPALCHLARHRNVAIIPVVAEPQSTSKILRRGRQTDHLPALSASDVVYTAGAPAMVDSVARIAAAAAARCYADAFAPQANQ